MNFLLLNMYHSHDVPIEYLFPLDYLQKHVIKMNNSFKNKQNSNFTCEKIIIHVIHSIQSISEVDWWCVYVISICCHLNSCQSYRTIKSFMEGSDKLTDEWPDIILLCKYFRNFRHRVRIHAHSSHKFIINSFGGSRWIVTGWAYVNHFHFAQ